MNKETTAATVFTILVFTIVYIIFMPAAFIWAWNTLFGAFYVIPLTWQTWLATVLFGMFLRPNVRPQVKSS